MFVSGNLALPANRALRPKHAIGFTLIEVLIALAITAFVSMIAYTSLSSVLSGVERLREKTEHTYEINRAFMILSRDLRQFVNRPVRDEFGEQEPALTGGLLARFALSFTRSGWHNPRNYRRSNLQRVNYRLEGEELWRDSYAVLDRTSNTEPESALLLAGVEQFQLRFLGSLAELQIPTRGGTLETLDWPDSWVQDTSVPGQQLVPPVAVEISLRLTDAGEMRRLYALPPL